MKKSFLVVCGILFSTISAWAFPEGSFVCGTGDVTNEITITKTTVASETVPFLKVHIKRPELESKLSGVGLLIEITDKKTSDVERRIILPGSNVDISYTKDDEIGFANFASRCRRK
jgi:hypothetical protein